MDTQPTQLNVTKLPIDSLIPYARNARTHSPEQVAEIAASIKEFGFNNPVLIQDDHTIIAGHGRVLAARLLELAEVPCIYLSHLTRDQARAFVLADNQLATHAGWNAEMLSLELDDLKLAGFGPELLGFSDFDLSGILGDLGADMDGDPRAGGGSLSERFLIPPFTVLNARDQRWQERKNAWLGLGIRSELGRGDNCLTFSASAAIPVGTKAAGKRARPTRDGEERSSFGKCLETGIGKEYGREEMNATSIFDPVLCELVYRWFTPKGGLVLDPFAGGSVRGVVASLLGRQYLGLELRPEQVEANRAQAAELCQAEGDPQPVWIQADSRELGRHVADPADLVFSCPPYADLEVYSDDPRDLSVLSYPDFLAAYRQIIAGACAKLKENRFACFVVGEVRDSKGRYRDFVGDTIRAFMDAGLAYYNEAILVTMVGSLPIRCGKQFSVSRKLGKTHQNVLVFVKGDPRAASTDCGPVEVDLSLFEVKEE